MGMAVVAARYSHILFAVPFVDFCVKVLLQLYCLDVGSVTEGLFTLWPDQ